MKRVTISQKKQIEKHLSDQLGKMSRLERLSLWVGILSHKKRNVLLYRILTKNNLK